MTNSEQGSIPDDRGQHIEKAGIVVDGHVFSSRSFSYEDMLNLKMVEAHDLLHACGTGEPKGRIKECRGVLLTDVIDMVDVKIIDHNDTKKLYLTASSDDGYSTVFSWQELYNTQVGEGVIVVLERDGTKLYQQGYVDLLSINDFLSGPRHVKRLANIRILMIP